MNTFNNNNNLTLKVLADTISFLGKCTKIFRFNIFRSVLVNGHACVTFSIKLSLSVWFVSYHSMKTLWNRKYNRGSVFFFYVYFPVPHTDNLHIQKAIQHPGLLSV